MRLYDYPLSEDFLQFLSETKEKIDNLVEEVNAIRAAVIRWNDTANIRQAEIDCRLTKLEHEVYMADIDTGAGNILVIHEPFVDDKSYDRMAIHKQEAEIVTDYNMLTLGRTVSHEAAVASVRILDGNGQPGNIHQVYRETAMYHARDGLHTNLWHIVDGNADTWFEYEKIRGLRDNRYHNTMFSGGLHWLKFDPAGLFVNLELELDSLEVIGAVVVEPFIPSIAGYKPAKLDSIIIDDGRGARQQLAYTVLDRTKFITCIPQLTRKARSLLTQDTSYQTWIGVPVEPYPISIVGMKYDPATGLISQPECSNSTTTIDEAVVIEQLFSLPTAEMAPALRYQIGLKQISLLAHMYNEEAEYVSKLYQIPGGIGSVQLDVDYTVPSTLRQSQPVKVSLSVDDCATWHYIAGNDLDATLFHLPRRIVFGKYVPQFMRNSDTLYMNGHPDTLRVRIELARPGDGDISYAQYITPVVSEYTIIIEQARAGE